VAAAMEATMALADSARRDRAITARTVVPTLRLEGAVAGQVDLLPSNP